MAERKSVWGGVYIGDERGQIACKSWFAGMAADDDKVLKANILERMEDGRELKLRVLIERPDGTQKELVRARTAQGFSLTSRAPTSTRWA